MAQRPAEHPDRPRAGPIPSGRRAGGRRREWPAAPGAPGAPAPSSSQGSARGRSIRRTLAGLMVGLGAGVLGWVAWHSLRWRPRLAEAIALADAGRFDEAEAKLQARLAADPDDSATELLLAQLALK